MRYDLPLRKALLAAGAFLIVAAAVIAVTGGLDTHVAGVPLRARDPFRAFIAGLTLILIVSLIDRHAFAATIDAVMTMVRRRAAWIAVVIALALGAHAIAFGTFTAGGSDAFGYVNQAYDWAGGRLPRPLPVTASLTLPASDAMQAPLGYRVGPQPHTIVPTYAAGLPLLMALSLVVGPCGPFLVVPLFAVLFVWFTFRLGRIAAGPSAAVVAAIVIATSPVVLFQSLWPMSDIPAGALWTGAIVCALDSSRRRALAAGLFTALALLVRPNLPLVAAAPFVIVVSGARGRECVVRAALLCAPVIPVVVFVAAINTVWYGAPSNSGYGAASELYAAANVWPNLERYASWLWQSQSLWVLLALVPLVPPFSRRVDRRAVAACVVIAALTVGSYASYAQFEEWWYLRFLLPAFGGLAVLIAAGIVMLARAVPQPFGRTAAAMVLGLMVATTISFAADKGVFGTIRAAERRYADVGHFASARLPANAALFAVQHSGSLRFYSGRLTLRFDLVRAEWAAGVPAAVERSGYHPYLVVDDWELPQVREQFGLPADAPLPWPIVARMRDLGGLTVFDMASRPAATDPVALEPAASHACEARSRTPI